MRINKVLNVGDRVKLVLNRGTVPRNKHFKEGTIKGISRSGAYKVVWDGCITPVTYHPDLIRKISVLKV